MPPVWPIELLAPARDLSCGKSALDHGADAVYVGAPRFGARAAVGNSLDDIAALAEHAHRFWARVYVTLNTLLTDQELPEARRLVDDLADRGVDGVIVQDTGLLEGPWPDDLMLISSTQMHNADPVRIRFRQDVGFHRAILARELSLDEIREIRAAAPGIELECFVHGALCVSYAGRCYLSHHLGGRSANRGECAQPCRLPWTLEDAEGRVLLRDKHLLSLKDLDLSAHLGDLLDAGVTSFKIEGRLKNRAYVATMTARYRALLDGLIAGKGLTRASSGTTAVAFEPDPDRVFHRGRTSYFLTAPTGFLATLDTPKAMGPVVGGVTRVHGRQVSLRRTPGTRALGAGDGLVFFDGDGELRGTRVNRVEGSTIEVETPEGLQPGVEVHRNHDRAYLDVAGKSAPRRLLGVRMHLRASLDGLELEAVDEDGVTARAQRVGLFDPAKDPDVARSTFERQLAKTGGDGFACSKVTVEGTSLPHLRVAEVNALRREVLASVGAARAVARPRLVPRPAEPTPPPPFPATSLDYRGNVLNAAAKRFYERHGATTLEPGAEAGADLAGRPVMTTRYCLRRELGWCLMEGSPGPGTPPLVLVHPGGCRFELVFDCPRCRMEVLGGRDRTSESPKISSRKTAKTQRK